MRIDNMTLVFLGCWTARTIHGFTDDGENNNGYRGDTTPNGWFIVLNPTKKNWWSGVSTIFRNSTSHHHSQEIPTSYIFHPSISPSLKLEQSHLRVSHRSLPRCHWCCPCFCPSKYSPASVVPQGEALTTCGWLGNPVVTSWKRWLRNSRNANHVSSNATKIGGDFAAPSKNSVKHQVTSRWFSGKFYCEHMIQFHRKVNESSAARHSTHTKGQVARATQPKSHDRAPIKSDRNTLALKYLLWFQNVSRYQNSPGWWFEPLWKILVNWDDYSQYMGK